MISVLALCYVVKNYGMPWACASQYGLHEYITCTNAVFESLVCLIKKI